MAWTTDLAELVAFASVAIDAALIEDTAKDMLYFFEKPQKWEPEHELWVNANRPVIGDDGWPFFCRQLDRLDERN